uniref:Uncharacterized protein n=1 Tax=Pithovirus LCPAC403 TaxID=2506596 RepID=A0A481ZCM2_9VIRU|nr:MAG: uncharacterized protein LCPAC403_00140 [Pithovirus LCPAC403]
MQFSVKIDVIYPSLHKGNMDPYYGTIKCQSNIKNGSPCNNNAYWKVNELPKYRCGTHSRKFKSSRVTLVKDPERNSKKAKLLRDRKDDVEKMKRRGKGHVKCAKLLMMKKSPYTQGYLNVFPNFKHQNRKDGFGCKSLSPMSLGPVVHKQPDLPDAENLENFHQGSKVFSSEIIDEKGDPTSTFFDEQKKMFKDKIPHRHKEAAKKKNVPLHWLWKMKNSTFKRFRYVESRQFYCTFYERLSEDLPDLKRLKDMIEEGYNLQICGYDAIDDLTPDNIEQHYLDSLRPFGHESVLLCLLVLPEDKYPWRMHKSEDF